MKALRGISNAATPLTTHAPIHKIEMQASCFFKFMGNTLSIIWIEMCTLYRLFAAFPRPKGSPFGRAGCEADGEGYKRVHFEPEKLRGFLF